MLRITTSGLRFRRAFAEFTDVYLIELDFKAQVESEFNKMMENTLAAS